MPDETSEFAVQSTRSRMGRDVAAISQRALYGGSKWLYTHRGGGCIFFAASYLCMPQAVRFRSMRGEQMIIRQARFIGALVLLHFTLSLQAAAQTVTGDLLPQVVQFNRDIRPILSDKCFTCHGPDKARRMKNLRFDIEEEAKRDLGVGRFAIFPGDPDKSELMRRVTLTNPAARMPMGKDPLSDKDVALLRRWIEQGAVWEKHWSFVPPKRPDLPKVKDPNWPKNPIDYFVLERLEQEGLKPSPEADRATLIRRVSLDLTGVPPTPGEVQAFLADKSANAYEKVVDRLLQSPRYGERMASPWLDAARYADSNGYLSDRERRMWRWRDWVINAFNRNIRFDQFTIEQLAGDLLPNASLDQKIATGFNRDHRISSEGGIIPEEYLVEYAVDRVETTSTVFLGVTLGCTRCHDHKFDPFTQKEFYQMLAYFNNVPESGKGRRYGNSPPFIKAPTSEQQVQLKRLEEQVHAAEKQFANLQPERAERDWEKTLKASTPVDWSLSRGLLSYYALDGDLTTQVAMKDGKTVATLLEGEPQFVPGKIGQAMNFDGKRFLQADNIDQFGHYGYYSRHPLANEHFDDAFTLSAWVYPTADTGAIVNQAEDNPEPKGTGLYLVAGKLHFYKVIDWAEDGLRVEGEKPLELNRWHHVAVTYNGTRVPAGVKLYVDGAEQKLKVLFDELSGSRRLNEPLRIGAGGGPDNRFKGRIDDVRIYGRALSQEEVAILGNAKSVSEIASLALEKRGKADADKIRAYFAEKAGPANIREAWQRIIDARERLEEYYEDIPTVMVMEEMPSPRETHLLNRGVYDQPGEKVDRGTPGILPPMPAEYPKNRLGLARWLVDPSNPLTARANVNRFWQMFFGAGLVRTVENLGSQGEVPSHPALLDWLATEFIGSGWDVKALLKTIVTSSTYRQSSKVTQELLEKDPENRVLARGPRFRLPAEMVRDQALAFAGLLVDKIGGPPVKPYQPEGLWRELVDDVDYEQDHGENLYRRSIYTFRKRAVPPPTMATFDASSRESCVVRQSVTNTPLQALDLMNNVAFVEAARVFAQRIMKEGGTTPEQRIAFAFRVATAQSPNPAESAVLLDLFRKELDEFKREPDMAQKSVSHGEYPRNERLDAADLAAYTSVTRLILNLDKTITKE